jgi:hypothetical protein
MHAPVCRPHSIFLNSYRCCALLLLGVAFLKF